MLGAPLAEVPLNKRFCAERRAEGVNPWASRSSVQASASVPALVRGKIPGHGARDKASEHVSDHQCADAAVGLARGHSAVNADSCTDGRF